MMTMRNSIAGILLCALFLSCAAAQESKVIELRSADRLEGKIINNEEVRELTGNVYFVQLANEGGPVHVWCDRALRFIVQNRIEMYGHVKVIRDSVTIHSNEGVYYGDRKKMEARNGMKLERGKTVLTATTGEYFVDEKQSHFIGNVVLVDTASTITSNELYYYEDETRSVAIGNVHAIQHADAVNIYGDSLVHIERDRFTLVMKHPRLVKIDTSTAGDIDTTVIISRVMKSFQDTVERFIAIDSVQMARDDLAARCGLATYFGKNDLITLQTHPIIWSGGNQITGDSMWIRIKDNKIQSLYVKQRAMAISQADSATPDRYNQLTGKALTMYFRADKLDKVDVEKSATSFYYLFDQKEPNGANKSSGDRILIDFIDGEIDRIKIIAGVQGQYFPEKMLNHHESDYNLDGFRLYGNMPEREGEYILGE
jgi:lipopolysaccharide export system protein LptA